jgi:hypothetical protein
MRLGKKQELFSRLQPRLYDHIHSLGYEIRTGDWFRDPRLHGEIGKRSVVAWLLLNASAACIALLKATKYKNYGHFNSCHKYKLAVDVNLTFEGIYLEGGDAKLAHDEIHDWWDEQHELTSERIPHDLNHYSLTHEGMR